MRNEEPEPRSGGWLQQVCLASAEYCVVLELEESTKERGAALNPRRGYVGGPKLARWLQEEMDSRDHMSVNRLHTLSKLDKDTINKMLRGERVQGTALAKLATGLSHDGAPVSVSDIPTD